MVGMSLRISPFSPFSESAGVSESLLSPFRGEEQTGGEHLEGDQSSDGGMPADLGNELSKPPPTFPASLQQLLSSSGQVRFVRLQLSPAMLFTSLLRENQLESIPA